MNNFGGERERERERERKRERETGVQILCDLSHHIIIMIKFYKHILSVIKLLFTICTPIDSLLRATAD